MSKKEKLDQAVLKLAIQHHESNRLAAAEEIYRDLLEQNPKNAKLLHLLALLCAQTNHLDEAIKLLRRSIDANPSDPAAHFHLGNLYKERSQLDQAIAAFEEALKLKPDFLEARLNLGTVHHLARNLDEALASFRAAVLIASDNPRPLSNFLYTLHFHPAQTARSIFEAHREWQTHHAEKYRASWPAHTNSRDPYRRLRIGYVSPDFSGHVVGRFIAPLYANHDHQQFEIFSYASVAAPDAMTQRLHKYADHWRGCSGVSDDQLARQIQLDQIDILIDLTMHMDNSRLAVFARKPAPVQATYLAYVSTTGVTAIDYRISDPYLDPPDADDSVYIEKTLRLPNTYWCYEAPPAAPLPGPLPAASANHLTFGCLNNFTKVSDATLDAWAAILNQLADSRLILHAYPGNHRDRAAKLLREKNIPTRRIEFVGLMSTEKYFALYNQIDIALDPFPYGGGTTTCDALYMGVPVITLAGDTAVGRGGVSILSNLNLQDHIAHSPGQYIQIASNLAKDLRRLQSLRASLRSAMQSSPLMDAPAFARAMESLYRTMWQNYCNSQ